MPENFYQQTTTAPATPFDVSLRPPAFSEFIGQEKVKDRVLLTSHADLVFEGMTVAAYAIGASLGFLYLRGEYRYLLEPLEAALQRRRAANLLGNGICGQPGFDFDIRIHVGAGSYVCGEETALIASIEGKRGTPRPRPPYPAVSGLWGQPTLINNVETFASVPPIIMNTPPKQSAMLLNNVHVFDCSLWLFYAT